MKVPNGSGRTFAYFAVILLASAIVSVANEPRAFSWTSGWDIVFISPEADHNGQCAAILPLAENGQLHILMGMNFDWALVLIHPAIATESAGVLQIALELDRRQVLLINALITKNGALFVTLPSESFLFKNFQIAKDIKIIFQNKQINIPLYGGEVALHELLHCAHVNIWHGSSDIQSNIGRPPLIIMP